MFLQSIFVAFLKLHFQQEEGNKTGILPISDHSTVILQKGKVLKGAKHADNFRTVCLYEGKWWSIWGEMVPPILLSD